MSQQTASSAQNGHADLKVRCHDDQIHVKGSGLDQHFREIVAAISSELRIEFVFFAAGGPLIIGVHRDDLDNARQDVKARVMFLNAKEGP